MASPLPDWVPINWDIVNNPSNWAIVVLMVLLGTILLCVIMGAVGLNTNSNGGD